MTKKSSILHSVHPRAVDHLRTIIDLSETNSIVETCRNLSRSRGTIKSHLEELSSRHSSDLFTVTGPDFRLTQKGIEIASQARTFLKNMKDWQNGHLKLANDAKIKIINSETGYIYCQSEIPTSIGLKDKTTSYKEMITVWVQCEGDFHNSDMLDIKQQAIIFRHNGTDWFTHSIGRDSLFTQYYGPTAQEEFLGMPIRSLPFGNETAPIMQESIEKSKSSMSPKVDRIITRTPIIGPNTSKLLYYDRLSLPCHAFHDEIVIISVSKPKEDDEWSKNMLKTYGPMINVET